MYVCMYVCMYEMCLKSNVAGVTNKFISIPNKLNGFLLQKIFP